LFTLSSEENAKQAAVENDIQGLVNKVKGIINTADPAIQEAVEDTQK
jgi:hypothetical protein